MTKYSQKLVYIIIINIIVYRAVQTNKWLSGLYPIGFVSVHANSLTHAHPINRIAVLVSGAIGKFRNFQTNRRRTRHDARKRGSVCAPANDRSTYTTKTVVEMFKRFVPEKTWIFEFHIDNFGDVCVVWVMSWMCIQDTITRRCLLYDEKKKIHGNFSGWKRWLFFFYLLPIHNLY